MADKNVLIKHKVGNEVDNIYPQTKATLVDTSATNTAVTGNTLSEVLTNAIPLKNGTNISISADGTISSNALSSIGVTAPITKNENNNTATIIIGHDNVLGGTTNTTVTPTGGELKVTVPEITATKHGHISAISGKEVTITLPADVVHSDGNTGPNHIIVGAGTATDNQIKSTVYYVADGYNLTNTATSIPTSSQVYNYVNSQITQGANYLGLGTDINSTTGSITDLSIQPNSVGDWCRVGTQFKVPANLSSSATEETAHVGDILICTARNTSNPLYKWDVLHTEVDTDTWRPIKVDGISIDDNNTLNTLNLKPGANITLSRTIGSGNVTISSTDTNTTYELSGEDAKVTLTASDGTKQSVTVNKVEQAASVGSSLIIKLNGGKTEGTNQFTFNGSTSKNINITPANIGAATSLHIHSIQLSGDVTAKSSTISGTVSTTIANGAVTKDKIKDGAVTSDKLGTSAAPGTYSAVHVTAKGLVDSGAQVYKYYAKGKTDAEILADSALVNGGFAFVEI